LSQTLTLCILTGPAQHHQFFLWSTNRLPNLRVPTHDILCWDQWAAL